MSVTDAGDLRARLVRATVLVLGAYWLLFAILTPVTFTDAHHYNLARLYVIRQGGLLANDRVVNFMQITYPWTFDAVHWPFLRLGVGASLPSFACFAGIAIITWRLVRERAGAECAWLCLLALLAMPTMMYQAVSTKTDIPIVFGAFCWYYTLSRFLGGGRTVDLVASAAAAAFAGGAKVSGPLLVPLFAVASIWMLRRRRRALLAWLGLFAVAAALLLSWETYLAAWRTFGDPLYMSSFIGNRDGVSGMLANLVRRAFAVTDIGQDVLAGEKSRLTVLIEDACRALLRAVGLADRGWLFPYTEAKLDLLKNGHEAQDAYGPAGLAVVLLLPAILVTRRPRDPAWRLAAVALLTATLVSAGIGYFYFQNRYFLLSFTLGAIAVTLWLFPWYVRSRGVRTAVLGVALWGAVVLPCFSYNRRPTDLWRAVADRDELYTRENPGTLPVLEEVRRQRAACPAARWVVVPRAGAWEMLFYHAAGDRLDIARVDAVEDGFVSRVAETHPGVPVFVLSLNRKLPAHLGLTELGVWPDSSPVMKPTRLYRYGDVPCPSLAPG